jgi:hypothetical protein
MKKSKIVLELTNSDINNLSTDLIWKLYNIAVWEEIFEVKFE